MKENNFKYLSLMPIILSLITMYITFKKTNLSPSDYVIIIGVVFIVFIYFIYDNLKINIKEKLNLLDKNTKKINKIENERDFDKKFYKLETELNIMKSNFNKKGTIDPRIILIIAMLVLVYILLRNQGYLP